MKNVTIVMEADVARWARIRAAELDTSLSRMLGEMLRERMISEAAYGAAMDRYLARPSLKLRATDAPYPGRDALHER